MNWKPIDLKDLESLLASELGECKEELREFFASVRVTPVKWRQQPWGLEGGGFWAVAVLEDLVLWYNDIEGGFNVSQFVVEGEIPDNEYWCNQDSLRFALLRLGEAHLRSLRE